jgi:uncharacterized protein (TIGR03435 family)
MRDTVMTHTRVAALAALTFAGALNVPRLGAQAEAPGQDPPAPVAYVASIRPSQGGRGMIRMMPGAISVSGVPIRMIIRQAYGPLQEGQLVGGPDWIDSERFDIEAKLEGPPTPQATGGMLRQMLADRFNLKVHTEKRDLPVFELMVARGDGRLGPSLKPSAPECVAMMQAGPRGGGRGGDGRGPLPPPPDARGRGPGGPGPLDLNTPVPCGMRGGGFGILRAGGTSMAQFATFLSGPAQRMVLDKTGLTGFYDIQLTYTPAPDQLPQQPPPPGVQLPPIDPDGPSLFTALQEQLGLKLESSRAPVDVVVIDSIDRPTEN